MKEDQQVLTTQESNTSRLYVCHLSQEATNSLRPEGSDRRPFAGRMLL